jgi:hypothetical protein
VKVIAANPLKCSVAAKAKVTATTIGTGRG